MKIMLYLFKRTMNILSSINKNVSKDKPLLKNVTVILFIIAFVVINAIIGKYLWNKFLVPAVSVVKPLKGYVDFLGLLVLFTFLHPAVSP